MTQQTPPARRVTMAELREHRHELRGLASKYGIRSVRVFGSVARGEADDGSDLDLLVEVEPGTGLLALSGFALDVEDLLHVPTQVATRAGLRERVRDRVLAEAQAL